MKINKFFKTSILMLCLGVCAANAAHAFGGKSADNNEQKNEKPTDKSLVQTDQNGVFNVGKGSGIGLGEKVVLQPGLYYLDDIDSAWSSEYVLLVDSYVNDPKKTLAILFKKDALDSYNAHKTVGKMFQGRPVKDGASVMLSPILVDGEGNVRVQSEMSREAPVIEIVARSGNFRYPFVLKPRNGALGGKLLGMRAATETTPSLKPFPSTGIFNSESGTKTKIAVSGDEVSIFSGSDRDQTFNLLAMNGDLGKFAALTRSKFDTMAEATISNEKIERMATFVTGCWDREVFMILTPTINYGDFQIEVFGLNTPGLFEWLFPGNRIPN